MTGPRRFTVAPFMLAFMTGLITMAPTNVFKICRDGIAFLEIEPWLIRMGESLRGVVQLQLGWLAAAWRWRMAFACVAIVIVALLAADLSATQPDVVSLAIVAGAARTSKRAKLLREAEALKQADGTFKDDATRAAFDAKMAEIDALDARTDTTLADIERHEVDAADPGAPLVDRGDDDEDDEDVQPSDRVAGAEAERARIEGILRAVRAVRAPQSLADKLIKDGVALVDAQDQVLRALTEQDRPTSGRAPMRDGGTDVRLGADPSSHIFRGIENALAHRVAPHMFKLEEVGRQYRGLSLLEVGRLCLQARGIRTTGMSKMEIAGRALGLDTRGGMHTSSDFPKILEDVANKTLRKAYDEAPQTFTPFSKRVTLPDFKEVKRLQLGEAPQLKKITEHGEYTRGTIGDGREKYALSTYGRIFAITRKAIINDDTDAFSRIPQLFGRSARDLESDLVWEQITSNPTMGDGVALFHATHGNLAGSGGAIDVTTLGAGRAAMRKQKALDNVQRLNVVAAFLMVPAGKETIADQFVTTALVASEPGKTNPFAGRLQVLAEPRLDDNSATAWYLAATPGAIDTIEYGYLEGEEGPVVESRLGFDVDGLEIKARHDFAAKVIDWRGFYKNPGA